MLLNDRFILQLLQKRDQHSVIVNPLDGELIDTCNLVVKVLASAVCGDFEATVLTHVCNHSCSVRLSVVSPLYQISTQTHGPIPVDGYRSFHAGFDHRIPIVDSIL